MVSLTMTTHEQDLVPRPLVCLPIQLTDFVRETLPLRFFAVGVELGVCVVGAGDEAEISSCLEDSQKLVKLLKPRSYG